VTVFLLISVIEMAVYYNFLSSRPTSKKQQARKLRLGIQNENGCNISIILMIAVQTWKQAELREAADSSGLTAPSA